MLRPGSGRNSPNSPADLPHVFTQASSLLGGTLGFAVKRASIPDLQRYLLDLDPYDDQLTEEFWETVRALL